MDAFAIGLKVANKLIEDKVLDSFIEDRYSSYTQGIGKKIVEGTTNFHELEEYAFGLTEIKNKSGKTERLKALINQYLLETLSSVRV
jgi:xylose isomerase